ncbi:MAG: site-2 protease family protein [Puniceicoccales bacterium]|jgi:RIP metalloprotease RseP|nr:site-2 protease family protein [Puniceicoccales bacterium]
MYFETFGSLLSGLWSCICVIVFFGGSIVIHELGHYLAARRLGFFIPRFSIGFGPKIFSWRRRETEFRLSLLPFGGYVALPQLAEMKEIEGEFKIPDGLPMPTCMGKIIVASMGVIFNLIFAFILASIIWIVGCERPSSLMTNIIGYVHEEIQIRNGQNVSGPAHVAGLKPGDEILSIDGNRVKSFSEIMTCIVLGTNRSPDDRPLSVLQIRRAGDIFNVNVYPELVVKNEASGDSMRTIGIEMAQKLIVHKVLKHTPAEKAGLRSGDIILKIDDNDVFSVTQLNEIINSGNESHFMTIQSGNDQKSLMLKSIAMPSKKPYIKLQFDGCSMEIYPDYVNNQSVSDLFNDGMVCKLLEWKRSEGDKSNKAVEIGSRLVSVSSKKVATMADLVFILKNTKNPEFKFISKKGSIMEVSYGDIKAMELMQPEKVNSIGVIFFEGTTLVHHDPLSQVFDNIKNTLMTLRGLVSRRSDVSLKNLMGPPGIIKTLNMFALSDFRLLLLFVITLNVNLAILNILPIPVLDGGQILMTIAEKMIGKNLSGNIAAAIQFWFMILFMLLIVYVSFFDIRRFFGDHADDIEIKKRIKLMLPEQIIWNGMPQSEQ